MGRLPKTSDPGVTMMLAGKLKAANAENARLRAEVERMDEAWCELYCKVQTHFADSVERGTEHADGWYDAFDFMEALMDSMKPDAVTREDGA